MNTTLIILLVVGSLILSNAAEISPTLIMKCCKNGEELSISGNSASESKCIPSKLLWNPFVYSPSKQNVTSKPSEWIIQEGKIPQCRSEYALALVPCSNYSPCIIFDDGNVMLDSGSKINLTPIEYCADSKALLVCMAKKSNSLSIYRCCGNDAVFHENRNVCINQRDMENAPPLLPNTSSMVNFIPGFPSCRQSSKITIIGKSKGSLLQMDGSLEVDGISLPPAQYCVERIKELNGNSKVFACSEYAPQRSQTKVMDVRFLIYPVSIIISTLFLAATLATGCLQPTSHHILHWRCQTYHIGCLMLGDFFMAVIQLASASISTVLCKIIAIMAHFFFLGAFFWLNTMCFNIWWTFRDLRPASLEKSQEMMRLRVYASYAWGGPLLISGLAALSDYLPIKARYDLLRPNFGEDMCWFHGDMEILAYFYGPIGILLAVNIVFFIATARELTCGLWKGEFVKSTTERATLGRVCLKLVVVMGITWIADVISWAVGGPQYIWYFTDVMNALQGLFIFLVVVWQPQVRINFKRLFTKKPNDPTGRQDNCLNTSHGVPSIGDTDTTQNAGSMNIATIETIC